VKILIIIFLGGCLSIQAQNITISGTISDAASGESLFSATIYNPETKSGTVTNQYGFFSQKFPAGFINIVVSYVGYETKQYSLAARSDTFLTFELNPSTELEEVTVSDQAPRQKVLSSQMGEITLTPAKIEKLPVLLGEVDIIKSLQLMPGVQGGTEGSSGFYVRGGGPDQNLILLDGVPVYNASHLFGFMSVFNADAIRNVSLLKGGFPARYGGRLSSVLDVRMKEGNMHEYKVTGSVGMVSSKLTVEGPIIKHQTSFMLSGRRSYYDILTLPIQMAANNSMEDGKIRFGYFLQDFNGKVNHKFNNRHRVYLSFYTGKDKFYLQDEYASDYNDGFSSVNYSYSSDAGLQWGNFTSALRWNYTINNELFSNITATVSNYKFYVYEDYYNREDRSGDSIVFENDYYYEYYTQIRDYALKADFDYVPASGHYIRFGAGATYHQFSPGVTVEQIRGNHQPGIDTSYGNINMPAIALSGYVEDDIEINRFTRVNLGLHYSGFMIEDTYYQSLEPRISTRFLLNRDLSVKASYVKMQQYLHLLANTTIGLPTDLWVPATARIKPQQAHQAAVGVAYALNNMYEFSMEGYYKKMHNLIEYREGASFFELNQGDWQDLVTDGSGESYGIEFLVRKNTGKLNGWIGYTISWAERTFSEISYGQTFPYSYDSRHDISVVASYTFNEKWDLGASWVFRTGYPFTLEDQKYFSPYPFLNRNNYSWWGGDVPQQRQTIKDFEHRNNYRMPNYHRLDVGANRHKFKGESERILSFGAYNAYGRANPFIIFTQEEYFPESGTSKTELKQLSIFTFLPYIRWTIKF